MVVKLLPADLVKQKTIFYFLFFWQRLKLFPVSITCQSYQHRVILTTTVHRDIGQTKPLFELHIPSVMSPFDQPLRTLTSQLSHTCTHTHAGAHAPADSLNLSHTHTPLQIAFTQRVGPLVCSSQTFLTPKAIHSERGNSSAVQPFNCAGSELNPRTMDTASEPGAASQAHFTQGYCDVSSFHLLKAGQRKLTRVAPSLPVAYWPFGSLDEVGEETPYWIELIIALMHDIITSISRHLEYNRGPSAILQRPSFFSPWRVVWEFFLIRCEVLGQGCLCVQIVKHSETHF